jgi:hypothetical protein
MDILYNEAGIPLMMQSTYLFGDTYTDRAAINSFEAKNALLMPHNEWYRDYMLVDQYKVMAWGKANKFPQFAAKLISETTVLDAGLKFLWFLTLGQGLFPCTVTGYDDDGNELLQAIDDPKLTRFINSRMCRKYMEKVLRDYFKFGNGAVHFVPGLDLKSIVGLNPLNALMYRYTEADAYGNRQALISGYWPAIPATDQYRVVPVLNEYDPEGQADLLNQLGQLQDGFVYPIRESWSNEDAYGEPRWWPAFVAGWVDIAHLVPQYLKKAYKNQTTWKWHVQIPYSYWDKKFPVNDYKSTQERKTAINQFMDTIEQNLLGPENAEKPLFTNYAINEANGRIEEEWKITALDNKYTGNENLVTSSAANSEILFSLMVNPNVFGAGMPGGTYSMNQGGSNIREAFLVNIANAWKDRQQILDPLELYIRLNGLPECQLRFRNTILTTLDKGAGTQKTLS